MSPIFNGRKNIKVARKYVKKDAYVKFPAVNKYNN